MFVQKSALANFCRAFGGIRANGRTIEQSAIAIARQYGGALLYARDNLTNIFQNSNGTGVVTTTGQPNGLWLDSALSFNATQPTGANKPIVTRVSNNLLRFTEDFTNAAWSTDTGGGNLPVITPNAGLSPFGELTADRVILDRTVSGVFSRIQQNTQTPIFSGLPYTLSFWLRTFDNANANVSLRQGGEALAVNVTGTWQRFRYTFIPTATSTAPMQLLVFSSVPSNSIRADLLVWGANLTQSSSLLPYEPADAFPRNGNFAVATNGINQFMTIANPPQITGDFTVVWAGRINSLATVQLLFSGDTANRLALEVTTTGSMGVYGVGGLVATSGAGYVTLANAVYSIRRTASGIEFRRNGVVYATVSGTFTFAAVTQMNLFTNSTTTSSYLNATTAEFFIDNQALPDADLLQIERFGAQRLGITI